MTWQKWLTFVSSFLVGNDDNEIECGLYMAESTIPNAGLGMFVGNRAMKEGDVVTTEDLMIPLVEPDWHNNFEDYHNLWMEYMWTASLFHGMIDELEEHENAYVISFGMGAAVNCMLPLVNVEDETEDSTNSAGVTSQSPGAGAFTPYHNRTFHATKDIPKGAELYAHYGESYFETRSSYESVPLPKTYEVADDLIRKFLSFPQKLPEVSSSLFQDLWDLIRDPDVINNSRLSSALPNNYTQLADTLSSGGTSMGHYNNSIRTIRWLQENGSCMDNIKGGNSKIPQAGRGAFATRFIAKGSLVAPAPLVHIPERKVFTMYGEKEIMVNGNPELARDIDKPIHQQLALNYCFGHRDTTLLLCPYGHLTGLINHSHKSPNAKIVWSRDTMMNHPEWLEMPLTEWGLEYKAGLSFDFVALRDIEKDEEITIDYGDEWEAAWQTHVQEFESQRHPYYVPAFELNRMVDLQIKTIDEYDYNKNGVHVFCRYMYIVLAGIDIEESNDWEGYLEYERIEEGVYPCRVVKRNHANSYMAELYTIEQIEDDEHGTWQQSESVYTVLFDVPRDAFYFRDSYYSRDHAQVWSFRHDMRIPDDIFPEIWKTKDSGDKTDEVLDNGGDEEIEL